MTQDHVSADENNGQAEKPAQAECRNKIAAALMAVAASPEQLQQNNQAEQLQQKWTPVLRPQLRQNNNPEQLQQKWTPVLRPQLRQNNNPEQLQQNNQSQRFRDSEKDGNALTRRIQGAERLANALAGKIPHA